MEISFFGSVISLLYDVFIIIFMGDKLTKEGYMTGKQEDYIVQNNKKSWRSQLGKATRKYR